MVHADHLYGEDEQGLAPKVRVTLITNQVYRECPTTVGARLRLSKKSHKRTEGPPGVVLLACHPDRDLAHLINTVSSCVSIPPAFVVPPDR